jgi:hypothetical protein
MEEGGRRKEEGGRRKGNIVYSLLFLLVSTFSCNLSLEMFRDPSMNHLIPFNI